MRVYLAAPYATRDRIRRYADVLRRHGITVECSWLEEPHEINAGTTGPAATLSDTVVAGHAWDDVLEVTSADAFVLFTPTSLGLDPTEHSTGGRHVETGLAIGAGVPVLVVGEPENIFHRLGEPEVTRYVSWVDALQGTSGLLERFRHRESRVRETE